MRVRLEAPDEPLAETAGHVLRPFATADGAEADVALHVDYGSFEMPPPDDDSIWRLHFDGLADARVDVAGRRADIRVVSGEEACLYTCFIVPILCEFLHRVDQHVIHAASLAAGPDGDRRAVLLAGESGTGKTTAALVLAQAGMQLMADDASFIGPAADGTTVVWGLPRACKVHEQTLAMLPWLADLPRTPALTEDEVLIELDHLPGGGSSAEARPGLIFLLQPRNDNEHRLTPADRLEAITELSRQNLRSAGPEGIKRAAGSFAALGELVRGSRAFRLSIGPDLASLPDRIGQEMEA